METSQPIFLLVALVLKLAVPCFCYYDVYINRDAMDTTYGMLECWRFTRTTHNFTNPWFWETCTCRREYSTMMSTDEQVYNCFTAEEVGCHYSLSPATKQAHLVTNTNMVIHPSVAASNSSIHRVLVWNLYPSVVENGRWEDITTQRSANFSLDTHLNRTSLSISHRSVATWKGLLIKVELKIKGLFQPSNCILLKFQGNATYPIDVNKTLGVIPPTEEPKPSTTAKAIVNITTMAPASTTIPKTSQSITADIYRYLADTTYGFAACFRFERTVGSWGWCKCKDAYTTMMSRDWEPYNCYTPQEVGCQYTLAETKQAFMITKEETNERLNHNGNQRCSAVQRVLIWNFHPEDLEKGVWSDITNQTAAKFSVNVQQANNYSFLSISNFNIDAWKGLTIKIEVSDNSSYQGCIIGKVQGRITYPFDLNLLLPNLRIPPPPPTPTVTTVKTVSSSRIIGKDPRDATVGMIVGTMLAFVAVVIIGCIIYNRRKFTTKNISVGQPDRTSAVVNTSYELEESEGGDYFDPSRQNSRVQLFNENEKFVELKIDYSISEVNEEEGEEGVASEVIENDKSDGMTVSTKETDFSVGLGKDDPVEETVEGEGAGSVA